MTQTKWRIHLCREAGNGTRKGHGLFLRAYDNDMTQQCNVKVQRKSAAQQCSATVQQRGNKERLGNGAVK